MQHSSASGSSRRRSPVSLDPAVFDAGAEQSMVSRHNYARTAMTSTTADAYYPYTMEYEHTNYTQMAASPYYTHAASTSSGYQYFNDLRPANNQQGLQNGVSYQSAPANWSSSAYHDHSTQRSVDSAHSHAATAAGPSDSSQPAPKMKPQPLKKCISVPQSTASTSHARSGDDASSDKAGMTSMMGRMRLPIGANTHAEAAPLSSVVGDKRKDRSSPPPTSSAEASPVKKKKEALRVKEHRKNRTEATTELAKRLPSHLQVYEAPSVKHIRQAIVHIDEQSAHIGRLESENTQYRAAQVQLASENCILRKKNETLLDENDFLQRTINEKDTRLRQLEGGRHW